MIQEYDASLPRFVFPEAVRRARHILIKPNAGYAAQPPVIVRMALLQALVDQLLALHRDTRISIVEGVCTTIAAARVFEAVGLSALAGERVAVIDAERLPLSEFANSAPRPNRFAALSAPALLAEVDARISVAPFKRTMLNGAPLISASIKNLFGLLPRSRYHGRSPHARGQLHQPSVHAVIADVYHTLGVRFDVGVIDLHEKYVSDDWHPDRGNAVPVGAVLAGADLRQLDARACGLAGEPLCAYQLELESA
jgi:uncharacterized protein (DUF362 family)